MESPLSGGDAPLPGKDGAYRSRRVRTIWGILFIVKSNGTHTEKLFNSRRDHAGVSLPSSSVVERPFENSEASKILKEVSQQNQQVTDTIHRKRQTKLWKSRFLNRPHVKMVILLISRAPYPFGTSGERKHASRRQPNKRNSGSL
jgi:hypothetical protein